MEEEQLRQHRRHLTPAPPGVHVLDHAAVVGRMRVADLHLEQPTPARVNERLATHAEQIASTCRWSVPQQPPRTVRRGSRRAGRRTRRRAPGSPASSSAASSSSAWLMRDAFARSPRMRRPTAPGSSTSDEMRRVGAVDHVVRRRRPRSRSSTSSIASRERLAARQAPVGLDREGDHRPAPARLAQPERSRRPRPRGHRDRA